MCRIASIFKYGDTNINPEHIAEMLKRMEYAGKDATGLAFISKKEDTVWYSKSPGKASDFVSGDFVDRIRKYTELSDIVLLHTRQATHGTFLNNDNNHPILGKQYVMIHNGVVNVKEKFTARGETDTEQLLLAIEKYGLKKGPEMATGSAAVILANAISKRYVYFYKTSWSPLELYRDKDNKIVYLASTQHIINGAVNKAKTISLNSDIMYRYDTITGEIEHYKTLNIVKPILNTKRIKYDYKTKSYVYTYSSASNTYLYPSIINTIEDEDDDNVYTASEELLESSIYDSYNAYEGV